MLYYLKGKVRKKLSESLLVEANGLGFLIQVSRNVFSRVNEEDEVELYVATVLRGDFFELYGFSDVNERILFDFLKTIDSVGPKIAFRIISTLGKDGIVESITKKNPLLLEKVEGIGKKTASKILFELLSKVDISLLGGYKTGEEEIRLAEEALLKLGMRKEEIQKVFSELDFTSLTSAEEIVRESLRRIGRK